MRDEKIFSELIVRENMEKDSGYLLFVKQVGSAAFYGLASLFIIMVNKAVLTSYEFPSFQFLGLGQIIATIVVLQAAKQLNIISFADLSYASIKKVFPLPILYIGNLLFGLGGTQHISLPMFVVLRRFSLLFTMIGEYYYLNVWSSVQIQISIAMMILGAGVAAVNDLSFNFIGYLFITANNVCTSANALVSKKMIDDTSGEKLNKYGILYYNAFVTFPPALLLAYCTGDIRAGLEYQGWSDAVFVTLFLSSCFMGFVLMYSILLCTAINSALTTMVTGCIKNIAVTYAGMVFGGDYVFSATNFIGINVSAIGSLVYSYVKYAEQQEQRAEQVKKHNGIIKAEEGKDDSVPLPVHMK